MINYSLFIMGDPQSQEISCHILRYGSCSCLKPFGTWAIFICNTVKTMDVLVPQMCFCVFII